MSREDYYHICYGNDINQLEESVNSFIRLGFIPQGGVFAPVAGGGPIGWYQAMLKEDRR